MRTVHKVILGGIMFAAMAGFISACAVGPDYVKPTAPTPAGYKEMEGWKVAEPKDHEVRGKWWEVFNDPQLNALEEQVNISNQNIAQAEAQFRQATALVKVAQASYFPTVTVNPSFTRSQRSSNLVQGVSVPGTLSSDHLLPANVSWEVDVWGRIRRSVESSLASAAASAGDLESVRLATQAALAQNYFQLLALDAQKSLFDTTVVAYEKSLELTKNRYTSGVASKADVLQAETQLKTTRAQAIDIGVQRSQVEHAVALLVGRPASDFSLASKPLNMTPPPLPVGLPSELLERRPDIAAAERRVAAANAQVGVAVAAYFPRFTLGASGGYESTDLSQLLTWPSRFWSLGPSLAGTVFDGGLRRGQTEQARAAYDATVAFYRQTVLTGFQEVEDNIAALRILEAEAVAQDEAVKAAQESLKVTLNQYKAGTVNYLNVVIAQAIANNNERVAASIAGRRMTAAVLLIKALGGGWKNAESTQQVRQLP